MLWQVSLDGQVLEKKSLCTVTSTLSEVADDCGKKQKHLRFLVSAFFLLPLLDLNQRPSD